MDPRKQRKHLPWFPAFSSWWILLGFVTGSGAVKVSVIANSIQVVRGGSALLPCSFHTTAPLSRLNIIWTVVPEADPSRPQQVIAYEQGHVVESVSHYTGRVGFAFSPDTSATIVLNDTRSSDSGTYQCSVMNPPDAAVPNIGVIQLTVFVPPSGPRCSSEGDKEEGGSLQFSCTVDEGKPVPTFAWEKIPPDAAPLLISYEDDCRALLTLHNLTADASGLYRCTASNMLGSVSCALELRVHITSHGTTSLVVGVSLMLSMGLVLLTLLALVLWLHQHTRDKHAEENSQSDLRADSFSLGRMIVAKSPAGGSPPANSLVRPLWVFTSSTPNTTYAHREWRAQAGGVSQVTPQGGQVGSAATHRGRWRSTSPLDEEGSSSGTEEEKAPTGGPFPKPTGFLV